MIKKLALIVVLVLVIGGVSGIVAWRYAMAPVNLQDHQTKLITVSKGQTFNAIAAKLTEAGLIRHPYVLKIAALQTGKSKSIQAGSFKLSPSMSPAEILESMEHGRLDISVTILEGWRREEIADSLATIFADNNLPFDKTAFLAATKGKEGYLFPDTYLLPLTTDAGTVASLLESTLQKKLTTVDQQGITASGHTLHDILTMASIVEREARTDEARKLVAGILWKRVANNWPLQADATLQFAKGYSKTEKTWWAEPRAVDKDIKSPYNTYKNIGLPPGPICSPSLSSIEATIFPKESTAWYYITDTKGVMHYADTIQQHNQNVETYLR